MTRGRDPDHFTRKAKKQGHVARSIYKLEEIDKRWKLLKKGDRVLDLGCSPGSWMQYAVEKVGPSGRVLGIDLKPVQATFPAHAEARVGDIYALDKATIGDSYDVVLSDMAPSTMGDHTTDALRSAGLAEQAIAIADSFCKTNGAMVVKVLEGGEINNLVILMRAMFDKVERLRPEATRTRSTEIFLVGLGRKARKV
ncbi:MAG: RlmE family RNA methyltransferase [Clostridia bacterium]|nr:RlmE family RNA methyltransferase [Deltaproteobacteria bacterium]